MGLQLSINAVEEKNSFILYDCTGRLSRENPGGWGGTNPEIKMLTDSYFLITPPTLPPVSQPIKIDTFPDFPNHESLGYEILPFIVGMANNEILSGAWKIKWVITGVDRKGVSFTHSTLITKIFKKQIECCVDKWTKILNKDAFKDKKQQKIIELNNLLKTMEYAIEHELNNEAISTIFYLQEQCICPDC